MSRTLVVRFPTHAAAFFVFLFSAHTAFAVPTFTSAPAGSANVGETYIYAIATADSESGDRSVSATALPSWLELTGIDAENGSATLQGTPTQANVGPHTVSLSVTNSLTNETATQEFTITVAAVNGAPSFTSSPVTAATQGSAYSYSITTSDPDVGDTRTVSSVGSLPAWLTLSGVSASAGTATLSGTPAAANVGTSSVTLRVTDEGGASATQSFTITVAAVNAAPTFTSAPVTSATQGSGAFASAWGGRSRPTRRLSPPTSSAAFASPRPTWRG